MANTAPNGIGISVSEPLPQSSYYPEPTVDNPPTGPGGVREAYVNVQDGSNVNLAIESPLDSAGGRPLVADNVLAMGTTPNYKTVFLQRLANPNKAYQNDPAQPNYNPYLTVDWSPIDLTVFNGTDRVPASCWCFLPSRLWDLDDAIEC